ncbi:MAG: GIY-YIG nuclease family protein [Candidatus Heimdallarchaeota archaeon]
MPRRSKKQYFTYILQCQDGSYYTGHTTNIDRRVQEHNSGIGGRYTRNRLPVKLVHIERHQTRKEAIQRELEIKKLSRSDKRKLIITHVPEH